MSWLLKQIAGAAGPYIVGALLAFALAAGGTAAVQGWRLDHAKADLTKARAAQIDPVTKRKWKDLAEERLTDLTTCQGNRQRLKASLDVQSAAVTRWKAEAASRAAEASQAAREARSARAVAESRAQALASRASASTCPGREAAIAELVKGLTR